MNLSPEEAFVIKLAHKDCDLLISSSPSTCDDIQVNNLLILIKKLNLTPKIYKNWSQGKLKNTNLSTEIYSNLKKDYVKTYFNNSLKRKYFDEFSTLLSRYQIYHISLKGIYLTEIFADLGSRPMSDIDVLIKPNDVETVKQILSNHNWSVHEDTYISDFFKEENHHPYTFIKNNTHIELHNKLHSNSSIHNQSLSEYWINSSPINESNPYNLTLSVEDNLQYLCLHLHKHLFNENKTPIKSFFDIVEFIEHFKQKIDWELFWYKNKLYNCDSEIKQILYLCKKYFHGNNITDISIPPLIQNKIENSFISALRNIKSSTNINNQINHIFQIKSPSEKVKAFVNYTFPSVHFMKSRYNKKTLLGAYFSYIPRIYTGLTKYLNSKFN